MAAMTTGVAFYAHAGLNVETYDARMAADAPLFADDLPVWRALAAEAGGPVLDLGTGTGRVAIDLAQRGAAVTGIDNAPAMLAVARVKAARLPVDVRQRLEFVDADMAAFDLSAKRFALALAPLRAFQLLPDRAAGRRFFATVFGHLRPGGRFAFDLADARPAHDATDGETEFPGIRNPATGRFVRIFAAGRAVAADPMMHKETWRFVETGPGGRVEREERETLTLRWTPATDLAAMLEEAGFRIAAYRPGFDAAPRAPRASDRVQLWQCVRP